MFGLPTPQHCCCCCWTLKRMTCHLASGDSYIRERHVNEDFRLEQSLSAREMARAKPRANTRIHTPTHAYNSLLVYVLCPLPPFPPFGPFLANTSAAVRGVDTVHTCGVRKHPSRRVSPLLIQLSSHSFTHPQDTSPACRWLHLAGGLYAEGVNNCVLWRKYTHVHGAQSTICGRYYILKGKDMMYFFAIFKQTRSCCAVREYTRPLAKPLSRPFPVCRSFFESRRKKMIDNQLGRSTRGERKREGSGAPQIWTKSLYGLLILYIERAREMIWLSMKSQPNYFCTPSRMDLYLYVRMYIQYLTS